MPILVLDDFDPESEEGTEDRLGDRRFDGSETEVHTPWKDVDPHDVLAHLRNTRGERIEGRESTGRKIASSNKSRGPDPWFLTFGLDRPSDN